MIIFQTQYKDIIALLFHVICYDKALYSLFNCLNISPTPFAGCLINSPNTGAYHFEAKHGKVVSMIDQAIFVSLLSVLHLY